LGAKLARWWFPERRAAFEASRHKPECYGEYRFDRECEYLEQHCGGLPGAEFTRRYLAWGVVLRDQLSQMEEIVSHDCNLMVTLAYSPTASIMPRCFPGSSKWRDSNEVKAVRRWHGKADLEDFFEWRDMIVEVERFIDELEMFFLSLHGEVFQPLAVPQKAMPVRQRSAYFFDNA